MSDKEQEERRREGHEAEATDENQPEEADVTDSPETPEGGDAEKAPSRDFPIVGIGASAGGLAAFETFFKHLPAKVDDTEITLVLIQHLDPHRESALPDIVARYTEREVQQASDGVEVKPGQVYVIPPNREMAVMHGKLHLLEPTGERPNLPIDYFFRSLAHDQRERAIGILLTGTGTDGTLGLTEIKGYAGMAMAQDPDTAEYPGMPQSAIRTGVVDYILPVEEMPERLLDYIHHAYDRPGVIATEPTKEATDWLSKIFLLLRNRTDHDFSGYKQNTIQRRIQRRMAVNEIEDAETYVRYLRRTPDEVDALFHELLIGVTSFFRDPEAYETLKEEAITPLVAKKARDASLRVWVTGCSTGEEAYSIAILLQEAMEEQGKHVDAQIFATDIDEKGITHARSGVYPKSIAADVSQKRLKRFFRPNEENDGYHVISAIRDMVIFAVQDITDDPPFSHLDLVSCRNLLIYMGSALQKKIISLFHYALDEGGYLFLGTSETVGGSDLFKVVDRPAKLYQLAMDALKRRPVQFGLAAGIRRHRGARRESPEDNAADKESDIQTWLEATLLEAHTPASLVVNDGGEVLYIHGRTGHYLEPAPGTPSMNLFRMARHGLRLPLTTAVHQAVSEGEPVHKPNIWVQTNGERRPVDLLVQPIEEPEALRGLLLVLLCERRDAQAAEPEGLPPGSDEAKRVEQLERELRDKEEYLQSIVEELEASNEELKSTNEELQSANEELQSTNEELETSKEELQSMNEELTTVNHALQEKLDQLSQVNSDMNNLLAGTATVFLDSDFRIQRFTPTATELINLKERDVGRPVGDLTSKLDYDDLDEDVREVLRTLEPKEVEIQGPDERWYLMHVRPYRTNENAIRGAVITFTEITAQKELQEKLRELRRESRLATVIRDSNDAVTAQDFQGQILAWNPAAARIYGWSEEEALKMNIRETIPENKREESLALVREIAEGELVGSFETQRLTKDGRVLDIWMTTSKLVDEDGVPYAMATTERNITGIEGERYRR
jgi:two-component system CheB/CheR fusion protein